MPREIKPYHKYFRFKKRTGFWKVIYKHRPESQISTGIRVDPSTKDQGETEAVAWAFAHMNDEVIIRNEEITLKAFAQNFFIPGKCPHETREVKKGKSFGADYLPLHRGRLVNYILPNFGPLTLSTLNALNIENWLLDLKSIQNSDKELSNESKNKILETFRIVLNYAVIQQYIKENPLKLVTPFAPNNKKREPFSMEELQQLFPEDREKLLHIWQSQMWATYFLTEATCGLRPGEVSALKWENWFRSLGGLVIKEALENRTKKLKGVKTEKKGVQMKPAIVTKRLEQELLLLEAGKDDELELIFHLNGKPIQLDTSGKHFRGACKRAGINRGSRTQYCLRHSFSTDLHTLANEEAVNRLMGHTKYRPEYDHRQAEQLLQSVQGTRAFVEEIRGL